MRWLLGSVTALCLSLGVAGTRSQAQAKGGLHPHHHHHHHHLRWRSSYRLYQQANWLCRIWDPSRGCYLYRWSYSGDWYYWCVPDQCFYMVGFCPYGTYAW